MANPRNFRNLSQQLGGEDTGIGASMKEGAVVLEQRPDVMKSFAGYSHVSSAKLADYANNKFEAVDAALGVAVGAVAPILVPAATTTEEQVCSTCTLPSNA